jgi:hypothetical protein
MVALFGDKNPLGEMKGNTRVARAWNFADGLDIIALLATLTTFLAYPLLWPPHEVLLDDMAEWGMKGPGASSLSRNMRGVYYLSGAKQTSRCNATERSDTTLCLEGYHRPLAFLLDSSYCKRQYQYLTSTYDTRYITCSGPFLLTSAHKKHSNGYNVAALLPVMRLTYEFDKGDPEFTGRNADFFEGALSLKAFYMPVTRFSWLSGQLPYRLTAEDSMGSGKYITRRTWWNATNTPQEKTSAADDWTFTMKRVMDEHGGIDRSVLADMKQIYGETVYTTAY